MSYCLSATFLIHCWVFFVFFRTPTLPILNFQRTNGAPIMHYALAQVSSKWLGNVSVAGIAQGDVGSGACLVAGVLDLAVQPDV